LARFATWQHVAKKSQKIVTMDRRQGAPKINDDVEAAMRFPPPLIPFWSSTTMMMLLVGFV
jgi:hypothetical protein